MRLRLFLSFALIALVAVASLVVIIRLGTAREVRAFMVRGNMTDVDALAKALEEYYARNFSWSGAEALLRSPGMGRGMGHGQGTGGTTGMGMGSMMSQRLRLADAGGNLLVDSANASPSGKLSDDEIKSAVELTVGGNVVGYLLPEGGMALAAGDERFLVDRITQAATIAALLAIGFALVLALLLAYRLVRPVKELTLAAEKVAAGDLSQRVPVRGKDELAALGNAFNQMADSIQQAEASRRAMTADISHELRNPLAVQRANLEALQDGIYPLTPDNLAPILEQNHMLSRLVDDLHTLALADSGKLELVRSPLDLSAMLTRLGERYKSQADAHHIQIQQTHKSILPLYADPVRVDQILSNLLSNALRYTPDNGKIAIQLEQGNGMAIIGIQDSGPGIPVESLPYVFDRFYRAEKSRSRAEGGSGLGLAIARQLAQAHGGSLEAANSAQGGAVFTLKLPLQGKSI
jgi:two-component system OmpR family sensor kinase/two-component system sensor histidine kinase BaeS